MKRKIGECFVYNEEVLKVVVSTRCEDCFFHSILDNSFRCLKLSTIESCESSAENGYMPLIYANVEKLKDSKYERELFDIFIDKHTYIQVDNHTSCHNCFYFKIGRGCTRTAIAGVCKRSEGRKYAITFREKTKMEIMNFLNRRDFYVTENSIDRKIEKDIKNIEKISTENMSKLKKELNKIEDRINPKHYKSHPSGVECITIARHYVFSIGNAFKYLWRAGLKSEEGLSNVDKEIEDLEKAKWYIDDRINELKAIKKCTK